MALDRHMTKHSSMFESNHRIKNYEMPFHILLAGGGFVNGQFKTMKHRPDYPDRFSSREHSRVWAGDFFHWYNHEHHHTGLGLMTPAPAHHGLADAVLAHRQQVLRAAYAEQPERFVRGMPTPPKVPKEAWINRPQNGRNAVPPPPPTQPGAKAASRVAGGKAGRILDTAEQRATVLLCWKLRLKRVVSGLPCQRSGENLTFSP
jgi:hypothetical protein